MRYLIVDSSNKDNIIFTVFLVEVELGIRNQNRYEEITYLRFQFKLINLEWIVTHHSFFINSHTFSQFLSLKTYSRFNRFCKNWFTVSRTFSSQLAQNLNLSTYYLWSGSIRIQMAFNSFPVFYFLNEKDSGPTKYSQKFKKHFICSMIWVLKIIRKTSKIRLIHYDLDILSAV